MKPSDALKEGKCPGCLGSGHTFTALVGSSLVCSTCNGTGEWPPRCGTCWQEVYEATEVVDADADLVRIVGWRHAHPVLDGDHEAVGP